jgi:DNA-directed RNA polymerase specialized sigma subunit
MTVKEYLGQGYRLEHRIKLAQAEIEELREMSTSISSSGFEEHYNASKNMEAPFERVLLKIGELEDTQTAMLEKLLAFKQELMSVFTSVSNVDEQLVLHYRYLCNKSWVEIGEKLGWDERTIRRWHNKAIAHVILPENPMVIDRQYEAAKK